MRLLLIALAAGCAGDEANGDPFCTLDGSYDYVFVPTNGCEEGQAQPVFVAMGVECSGNIGNYVPTDRTGLEGSLSCEPGDPVVRCVGFATRPEPTRSEDCRWDVSLVRSSQ